MRKGGALELFKEGASMGAIEGMASRGQQVIALSQKSIGGSTGQ